MSRQKREQPGLHIERHYWSTGHRLVAGVDEVGRGCLAGPVVAAACVLPPDVSEIPGVHDSKLLTGQRREEAVQAIHQVALAIGVGAASVTEIEQFNIRAASVIAMRRALRHVGSWDVAVCDGLPQPEFDAKCEVGLVDGDAQCLSIACASIIAKVIRDRLMRQLNRFYPSYGWERNAGYGTPEHLKALTEHGITPFHRKTFRPVSQLRLAMDSSPAPIVDMQ